MAQACAMAPAPSSIRSSGISPLANSSRNSDGESATSRAGPGTRGPRSNVETRRPARTSGREETKRSTRRFSSPPENAAPVRERSPRSSTLSSSSVRSRTDAASSFGSARETSRLSSPSTSRPAACEENGSGRLEERAGEEGEKRRRERRERSLGKRKIKRGRGRRGRFLRRGKMKRRERRRRFLRKEKRKRPRDARVDSRARDVDLD